jgi:hypothetical protein
MLLDLYQKFVNFDGRVLRDISISTNEDGVQTRTTKDLTLERVVSLALAEPTNQKMSGDDKIKCFELLLQIIGHKDGVVELETDSVSFIKTLIKPKFPVLVVGEAMRMLEGKDIGIEVVQNEHLLDLPEKLAPESNTSKDAGNTSKDAGNK